ncbi:MAG: response regulator [Oscillospiraceae bacterium]|nr:response regulator [Oscillospiraceae bacterium]
MSYRVLVAEDEDMIRRGILCSVDWNALGCSPVCEARTGQEALEAIREGAFDIVLMDINMPIMNGLDVLELSHAQYHYVPILITGYPNFDFAQRALRYGCADYLLKPVDLDELRRALTKACAERGRRALLSQLEQPAEPAQTALLPPQREEAHSPVVDKMLAYIQENYAKKITLAKLSQELFYSESFMTHLFKQEMQVNFADYLNRYRIYCAIRLIRQGKRKLSELPAACGFVDYKYFNTVFKRYLGCSAKEYAADAKKNEIKNT